MIKETSISYYGLNYVEHAEADFKEMKAHGVTQVILAVTEFDFDFWRPNIPAIVDKAHELGLRVLIDPWGNGKYFGGEQVSKFLQDNVENRQVSALTGEKLPYACFNTNSYRDYFKNFCTTLAREAKPDGFFWDEPHYAFPKGIASITGGVADDWTCYCPVCRKRFEDYYGYPMPRYMTNDVKQFRWREALVVLSETSKALKEIDPNLEITCCVHATQNGYYVSEYRGYDNWDMVGACPYFDVFSTTIINWGLPEDFYRDITARTVAIAKKYGKKSERWLMGYYKQPKNWKQIDKWVDIAEELGVDRLAAWTYRGGYGTVVGAPDAIKLWDAIGENYKRVCKKSLATLMLAIGLIVSGVESINGQSIAAGSVIDDPLESVMPYPLEYEGGRQKLVERLVAVRDISGISRFALYAPRHVVRLVGAKNPADYAAYGKELKSLADELKPKGITCGFLAMPTINIGIRHPGIDYVCANGTIRPFSGCPRDSAFRSLFVSNMTAMASIAQPPFIMMEDDYRFFGLGCFCSEHLNAFAALTGRQWTRMDLASALKADVTLRQRWLAFQTDALIDLAVEVERAVGTVSPHTRIGLSAPGGMPERDILRIAKALAGTRRPFIRWYGNEYGKDVPVGCFGCLRSAQWAREHLAGDGHETFYEADTVPHTVMYGSSARNMALMEKAFAMGFDRMWFWGLGMGQDDLVESPDHLIAYRKRQARFVELRRMGHLGCSVGIQAEGDWYMPLNRLGFPVTTLDSSVRFIGGSSEISKMTDEEIKAMLAGRVVLDGRAANVVCTRGFGSLLGVASCGKPLNAYVSSNLDTSPRWVDFTGERTTDGSWTSGHFECAFHQAYGIDDKIDFADLKSTGAEEVSYYYCESPECRVRPAILKFINAEGGRVVVFASSVANTTSPNLFNFGKRRILASLVEWLSGGDSIPVRVSSGPNAYVIARDTPEGLFVHLTNLSCDTRKEYVLEVAARWRNGRIERLDDEGHWLAADVKWEDSGRAFLISGDVPVFNSLALKIVPQFGK